MTGGKRLLMRPASSENLAVPDPEPTVPDVLTGPTDWQKRKAGAIPKIRFLETGQARPHGGLRKVFDNLDIFFCMIRDVAASPEGGYKIYGRTRISYRKIGDLFFQMDMF